MASAGALVGTAAVVSHGRTVGLVLGLVATAAAAAAIPPGWRTRFAFASGWSAVLVLFLLPRPEGDYLISADVRGYTLLCFGLAVLLHGIVTVRPGSRPEPEPRP